MATSLCPGCIQRDRRIAELEKRIAFLQAQLEKSKRASKRQAAPFSKGEPNKTPRSTARPSGANYGKHGHRPCPPDDQIDETLEALLPDFCPHCGSDITEDAEVDLQYQEEIPIKPIHRKIRIHKGTCRRCGRRVRGRHARQTSDVVGAAASQIGPDAQATIAYLNKYSGLSYGKISDLFERLLPHPSDTQRLCSSRAACGPATTARLRRNQTTYSRCRVPHTR